MEQIEKNCAAPLVANMRGRAGDTMNCKILLAAALLFAAGCAGHHSDPRSSPPGYGGNAGVSLGAGSHGAGIAVFTDYLYLSPSYAGVSFGVPFYGSGGGYSRGRVVQRRAAPVAPQAAPAAQPQAAPAVNTPAATPK